MKTRTVLLYLSLCLFLVCNQGQETHVLLDENEGFHLSKYSKETEEEARTQRFISKEVINDKGLQRPDMPEKEPDVLLQMQQNIALQLGIAQNRTFSQDQSANSKQKSPTSGSPEKMELPRFSEEKALSELKLESRTGMHSNWETVRFVRAEASSVLSYFWSNTNKWSYPAHNAIDGWSYWCNDPNANLNIEYWSGEFDMTRRLSHLWIRWAYAPAQYRIFTATTPKNFIERIPWRSGAGGELWKWLSQTFWWWRWYYRSYAEHIGFEEPIWAKYIKIEMKDKPFYYLGIYRVEAWTKQWTVMIKSGWKSESEECLVTADGSGWKEGNEIQLMDCVDAISLADGREIWVLQNNFQISTYQGQNCIETANGQTQDGTRVQVQNCWTLASIGDGRDKWLIDEIGTLKFFKDQNKCLTAVASAELEDLAYNQYVEASSTINDGQHVPKRAVDRGESYWASAPGYEKANFAVFFGEMKTVKEIQIKWQYPAKDFEVQGWTFDGTWQTIEIIRNNMADESKMSLGVRNLRGVKILMNLANGKLKGKPIYGIKALKVLSGAKGIKLKDCNKNSNDGSQKEEGEATNKYILDDVNFIDLTAQPQVESETSQLNRNTNRLLTVLNTLIAMPQSINKALNKAKKIREVIDSLDSRLKDLDIKMTIYKPNVEDPVKEATALPSTIGSSEMTAAHDCEAIKRSYSHKISGYYWVKVECSEKARRVYCDFSKGKGTLYYYFGEYSEGKDIRGLVKSNDDIQYLCAKEGLEPVEIIDGEQLSNIRNFIADLDINLLKGEVIPLGYDYGCLKGSCSGRYQSFSSEQSPDQTSEFISAIDSTNILNMALGGLSKNQKESVGIGMSKKGLLYLSLKKFPIKGIVCSSNDFNDFAEFVELDCVSSCRGNQAFDGIENTNINARCPRDCNTAIGGTVWGDGIYKDDSAICKAAIHSGVIKAEEGGRLEIGIETGREMYQGSTNNGIKTKNYDTQWDRSFVVNKFVVKCPIEKFKSRFSSFLQINDDYFGKNSNDYVRDFLLNRRKGVEEGRFLENSITSDHQNDPQKSTTESSTTATSAATSSTSSVSTKSNTETTTNLDHKNSTENSGDKESEDPNFQTMITKKISNTEEAVDKILQLNEIEKERLKKAIKLVSDGSELVKQLEKMMSPIVVSDLKGEALKKRMDLTEDHFKISSTLMNELVNKATAKLKKTRRDYQLLKVEKLKLQKYEPYQEKYEFELRDVYDIFDHPGAREGPSTWTFTTSNLQGHIKAIGQTSNIFCQGMNGCTASLITLKYKEFFDGTVACSMLMRDNKESGILFRYKDPFNYYVFEWNQLLKWKRFRKVVNGVSTVIRSITDGGYLQNIWYRIVITFRQSHFVVNIGEESQNLRDDNLPTVLQVEDQDLVKGRVGFIVNGMQGLFIDAISVYSINCVREPELPELYLIPPECSRFRENYYGQLNLRWFINDPPEMQNGPSIWTFEKDYHGHEKVIYQRTNIYSKGAEKMGAFAELSRRLDCINGVATVDFFAEDAGIVGLAFRYQTSTYHYILEIGGDTVKFIQVRKCIDGRYTLIQRLQDKGYEKEVWYRMVVKMEKNTFKVFFSQVNDSPEQIFDVIEDGELSDGTLALMTYRTKSAFDNFKMGPLSDQDPMKEEENEPLKSDEPELSKKLSTTTKQKAVFDNEGPVKIQWDKCLTAKTPETREKHCKEMFSVDVDAANYCKKTYCSSCCEKEIDWLHLIHRFTCSKQCNDLTAPTEREDAWRVCIDSPKPNVSMYEYCENTFEEKKQKERCKVDSCRMCCSNSINMEGVNISETGIQDCHKTCLSTYMDTTDIFI